MGNARPREDQLTVWHTVGLVVLLLFALYPGIILGTDSFFYRDFGLFTYPVAYYSHQNFWHGQVPLWNPLNNCGVPFLAQWNTSVCYPLSLIYLLLPLPWSLNLFQLGHLVFASAGMYLLAYRWTENRVAASVAGAAFALNGLSFNCLLWTSNLAALSWQPWVVLWVGQAWQTGGRRVLLAALAGAMQMLAGGPEIIVFTWLLLGALWLGETWRGKVPFWPSWRRLLVMVVLVATLSAIQLLPFLDFLKHSQRNSSYDIASTWPMPVWGWANLVVPLFRSSRSALGTFFQEGQSAITSYYVGIGTLAFAAIAACRLWHRPRVVGLAVATLAGLVLALGNNGHVYTWLKQIIPWIGFARYPIKFVALPIFTLPLLAAYGLKILQGSTAKDKQQAKRALLFISGLLLVAICVVLAAARWQTDPRTPWQPAWTNGAVRTFFLIAIVGCLLVEFRLPATRLRGFLNWGLLALVGLDLMTAGANINPVVTNKAFGPLELNMSTRPQPGKSRAMVSPQVAAYIDSAATTNALYYYVGLRGTLFENCNIPENIPKVGGFSSLHLKDEWDIEEISNEDRRGGLPAPLLNFLGVSQISASNSIFAWQARQSFLPMATAGQKPIFANETDTLKKLAGPDFDPAHDVYLPLSAREKVTATNAVMAKITAQHFAAQRAQIFVEAPAPTLVVIAQTYYHDWRAYVDGKPATLLRANHAFQAVQVPAGHHEITLRYVDLAFRAGAIISATTLLGFVGVWLLSKFWKGNGLWKRQDLEHC